MPWAFQCSPTFEAKQVNGEHGFRKVLEEARSRPSTLWRGTAGANWGFLIVFWVYLAKFYFQCARYLSHSTTLWPAFSIDQATHNVTMQRSLWPACARLLHGILCIIYSHASASLHLLSCPPFVGAGSVTSTWAGFYAWCWTNNWLHEVLPISAFRDSETARTEVTERHM